jgi:hypothetical protein
MHTACVWSVKLPFAEYSVEKDRVAARRARRRVPQPLTISGCDESRQASASWASRGPASQRRVNRAASNKVENTGLEPVTSWLQTRRSPS